MSPVLVTGGSGYIGGWCVASLLQRVREHQRAVGYEGNYRALIAKVTPPDLH